jgi:hypothetical protein
MTRPRKVLLACYGLAVALVFLWVPWTHNAGYWWLWSSPQRRPLKTYDLVAEGRQRLESDYQASDLSVVGQKWLRAIQKAPAKDRESVRHQGRQALELARLHREELRRRRDMSDGQLLGWLKEKGNFDAMFPEKANLDSPSRQRLFDEWERTVPAAKEWNEQIAYSKVDYRRIAMELVALTAMCAVGFVLTIRIP